MHPCVVGSGMALGNEHLSVKWMGTLVVEQDLTYLDRFFFSAVAWVSFGLGVKWIYGSLLSPATQTGPIPVRELCLQKYRGTIFVKLPSVAYFIPTHNSFFRKENGGFSYTVRRNWLKCGGRRTRSWRICSKEAASIKDSKRKIIIENWSVVKRGMFPQQLQPDPKLFVSFLALFLRKKKNEEFLDHNLWPKRQKMRDPIPPSDCEGVRSAII